MKGWLVYDGAGAKRNAWFVQKLLTECALLGLDVRLQVLDKREDGIDLPLPDFAIVRTMNTKISEWLDGCGVRLFNDALTARIACDKWQTYQFCRQNGIPVLDTCLIEGDEPPFPFPFVVKSRDGHGGNEVFLCSEKKEWKSLLRRIERSRFIAQPFCDEAGKDMRVYLCGGQILAAMLRTSNTDFRSNFSLGGRAEKCHPTNKQLRVLKKVEQALAPDFVGVDFIRDKGEWLLNEIEDPVGTRMLYEHTDIDAAKTFARQIYKRLLID